MSIGRAAALAMALAIGSAATPAMAAVIFASIGVTELAAFDTETRTVTRHGSPFNTGAGELVATPTQLFAATGVIRDSLYGYRVADSVATFIGFPLDAVTAMTMDNQGMIYAASGIGTSAIRAFDTRSQTASYLGNLFADNVTAMATSGAGVLYAATRAIGDRLMAFDPRTGTVQNLGEAFPNGVSELLSTPDGRLIAATGAAGSRLMRYTPNTGELQFLADLGNVVAMTIADNWLYAATGNAGVNLTRVNLGTGQIESLGYVFGNSVTAMAALPAAEARAVPEPGQVWCAAFLALGLATMRARSSKASRPLH